MLKEMKNKRKDDFKPLSLGNDVFAQARYERASREMVAQLNNVYQTLSHSEFKNQEKEIYQALKKGIFVSYVVDVFQAQTPAFKSISDENILSLFKLNIIELVEIQKKFTKLSFTEVKFIDNIPMPEFKAFEHFTTTPKQNELVELLNDMIETYDKLRELNPNLYPINLCSSMNQMLKLGGNSQLVINPDVINRMA